MSLTRVTKRYARALFNLSEDQEQQDSYLQTLLEMRNLFDHEDIRRVLLSPVVPVAVKLDVLNYVVKIILGEDKLFSAYINEIVTRNRTDILLKLSGTYQAILDVTKGAIHADLISASPLGSEVVTEVKKSLAAGLQKEVFVKEKRDESLIGGLVIEIGNSRIDLSLRRKIDALIHSALA